MESIILLMLFVIVPSIIKNMLKTDDKQKQTMNNTRINQTKVHQSAKKVNRPASSNSSAAANRKIVSVQAAASNASYNSMEQNKDMENMQTEGLPQHSLETIEPQTAAYELESQSFLGDITIDELQRSIVMAEILGKPKALRKRTI